MKLLSRESYAISISAAEVAAVNKVLFYVLGYYTVKIDGCNVKRLFKACINRNIDFRRLLVQNQYIFADVCRNDYKLLLELSEKTGTKVTVIQAHGLPAVLNLLSSHKYYVFLACVIAGIFYYLNTRLMSVEISGNSVLTSETILKQLENENITRYSDIRKIDCNELEETLIENNKIIKWCSIYTKGNLLYILIDEEVNDTAEEPEYSNYVSNVYGTVKSIYVRSGYPMVKAGDIVEPGTVLLTGEIPITNTYDEVLDTRQVIPDGDIVIEFNAKSQLVQPYKSSVRVYNGEIKKGFELSLLNNKLFSYLPSISYDTCDIISENADLEVLDFSLPVSLTTYRIYNVSLQEKNYTYETAEQMLLDKYSGIKESFIRADYRILNEDYEFSSTEECLLLDFNLQAEGPAYFCN